MVVEGFRSCAACPLYYCPVLAFQAFNLMRVSEIGSFSNCSSESSDGLSCMEQFSEFAHAIHTVK